MKNRKVKSLAKSKVRKCFRLSSKLYAHVVEKCYKGGGFIVKVTEPYSLYEPFVVEVKYGHARVLFYDHIVYMPYENLA